MKASDSVRQCIKTKYLGPTDYKGSRVKAYYAGGSITLSWDDALNSSGNHMAACLALADKLGWDGKMVGGWYDNDCYWVFNNDLGDSE